MMSITKNTLTNSERLRWFQATIALSFVAGIFFARQLFWNIHRSYPLTPVLQALQAVPWVDTALSALLITALIAVVLCRRPKLYLMAAIAITAVLFLEDQSRLFPSFYEYFLFLIMFAWYARKEGNEDRAGRILSICRLAMACIYFWSGAQKLTPSFEGQLSWVLAPLSEAVPWLQGNGIHWLSLIAPFIEMEIGVGLLFKKTRNFALAEALLMHGTLFLFIGPFRDAIHESAWIWNVASACATFVLFFNISDARNYEHVFDFTDRETRVPRGLVVLTLAILPLLSFVNLWDSSLSFNVFSGNVAYAEFDISPAALRQLPPNVQNYGSYGLDINRWAEDEFGAEPSPEPRVLKEIADSLCSRVSISHAIRLTIYDKLTFFESPATRTVEHYTCP